MRTAKFSCRVALTSLQALLSFASKYIYKRLVGVRVFGEIPTSSTVEGPRSPCAHDKISCRVALTSLQALLRFPSEYVNKRFVGWILRPLHFFTGLNIFMGSIRRIF